MKLKDTILTPEEIQQPNLLEVYDFVKTKEYHWLEDILFIDNSDFNDFVKLFNKKIWKDDPLNIYFRPNYFCVHLTELLDYIVSDYKEEILNRMRCENR